MDPWGGRRWLLHYPLLTQWTGLAGGCPTGLSGLETFRVHLLHRLSWTAITSATSNADARGGRTLSGSDDPFTHGIGLGTSLLYFDSRENVVKQMKGAQLTFANLELSDFLSRAQSAITKP